MKKKIAALITVFIITTFCLNVFASTDEFDQYKNTCIETISQMEYSDSRLSECLGYVRDNYPYISKMTEWPSSEGIEEVSYFSMGATYLYYFLEESSYGYAIGLSAWDALADLYYGSENFSEDIANVKSLYEEATGEKIFETSYPSGQHKVGSDMPSGEYVIFAENGMGYFAVSSDPNGNDIIANDNFEYNSIMTVKDGEYLKLSRSYAVPISEVETLPIGEANMFRVGTHIPAGEYCLKADSDMGYYGIYSSSRQDDIVANDNFSGQSYVSVTEGQYLVLSRCHIEQ